MLLVAPSFQLWSSPFYESCSGKRLTGILYVELSYVYVSACLFKGRVHNVADMVHYFVFFFLRKEKGCVQETQRGVSKHHYYYSWSRKFERFKFRMILSKMRGGFGGMSKMLYRWDYCDRLCNMFYYKFYRKFTMFVELGTRKRVFLGNILYNVNNWVL